MNQSLSNFIENVGIALFKATNRKTTDLETFKDCSQTEYDQIQSFYKNLKLFKSCTKYNPPALMKASSNRKVQFNMFKMDSMFKPIEIFKKPYDSLPQNKQIYFEEIKSLKPNAEEKIGLIYIHGFSESSYAPEKILIFDKLLKLKPEIEILAMQLPYHMMRGSKKQPYSGAYMLDSYPVVTIESFRQAVNDASQLLSYAKEKYKKVIIAGFSLGGFTVSFLATCDNRADLYIVGQAGAHIPKTLKNLSICPGLSVKKEMWIKRGIDIESLYEPIDLLNYKSAVPSEKVISIAGLFDLLIGFEDVEELRYFFKSGSNIDYPGGHRTILFEMKKIKEEVMRVINHLGAESNVQL